MNFGSNPGSLLRLTLRSGPLLALALVSGLLSLPAEAGQTFRIGYLSMDPPSVHVPFAAAFRAGLRENGLIEGKDITIEWRFAANDPNVLPRLVSELLAVNPDLLVADATQAALATQRATHTIPIVVPTSGDLVRVGLVKSLAHPGGNLTGLTLMSPGLIGKRLAVLKEMAPHVRTVGVLFNPDNPAAEPQLKEAQAAVSQLELRLQPIPIRQPNDIDRLLSSYARRIDAVFVTDDPIMDDFRTSIGAMAIKNRLPSVCSYRMPEDRSCLMWYGPDLIGMYKRAATYVSKILNGTKPADLPVEQPAKLSLVINAKTAGDIGLAIPPSLLLSADEVVH